MKKALKKWGIRLGIFLVMVFAVYLLRRPILRGAGSFLAKTDVPVKVDAAFVLSGAAKERTIRALELYPEFAPQLVTTGGMVAQALQALGMTYTGSEVMRDALLMGGVDSSHVNIIPRGTSTFEESEEILGYCLAQGYHRVMIVSSHHHTRRIGHVFRDKFRDAGIEVNVQGADPIEYRADQWWLDEDGLIFVVNEYAKILYYVWRY